ncbi:hypothetical protein BDV19DRAFT_387099 [Aspergillus venezuelensis]
MGYQSSLSDLNIEIKVVTGASIGSHSQPKTNGTFGGWIEIRSPNNGNWLTVGLTCRSCVISPQVEKSSAKDRMIWEQDEVPESDRFMADAPSKFRLEKEIDDLSGELDTISKNQYDQEVQRLREAGESVPSEKESI